MPPCIQMDNLSLYDFHFLDGLEKIPCNTYTWLDISVDEACLGESCEGYNNTVGQFFVHQPSCTNQVGIGKKAEFL